MPEINRVWIELERPDSKLPAEERKALGEARAAAMNRMLLALADPKDHDPTDVLVDWSEREDMYIFAIGKTLAWGYQPNSDNGKWFNLDYFGRERV